MMFVLLFFHVYRYEGPELEMWSLGVLLYTLLFSENPFFNVQETLQARLNPPCQISTGLELNLISLIFQMLTFSSITRRLMVVCVLELYGLLASLLHPVVPQRMTLEELLESPWLRQPVNLAEYSWGEVFPSSNGKKETLWHEPHIRCAQAHRSHNLHLFITLESIEHSVSYSGIHQADILYLDPDNNLSSSEDTPLEDEEEDEEQRRTMAALQSELLKYLTEE